MVGLVEWSILQSIDLAVQLQIHVFSSIHEPANNVLNNVNILLHTDFSLKQFMKWNNSI